MLKRLLLSLFAAAALLVSGLAPAQVAVDSTKTGVAKAATQLAATAAAVIIPSSGSSNAVGQITFTTALPATPVGTVGVFLPAGVVTAGAQGSGAGVYQATCSSTTVCTLTGSVTTANAAYTQSTNEQTLATVAVPAGSMGLNGGLQISSAWSVNNNANSKTVRAKLGGTSHLALGVASFASYGDTRRIRNRGSASSQVGYAAAAVNGGQGGSTAVITTGAVDTSVAQDIVITGQIAVATDFLILESYDIWQLP